MKTHPWALALVAGLGATSAAAQGAKGTFTEAGSTLKVVDAFAWEQPKEDPATGDTVKSIRVWLSDRPLDHKALVAAANLRAALDTAKSKVGVLELEFDPKGAWTDIGWNVPTSMVGSTDFAPEWAPRFSTVTVTPAGAIRGTVRVKPADWGSDQHAAIDVTLDTPIERRLAKPIPGFWQAEMPPDATAGGTTAAAAPAPPPAAVELTADAARQQLKRKGVDLSNKDRALSGFSRAAMDYDVSTVRAFVAAGLSPNEGEGGQHDHAALFMAVFPGCSLHKDAAGQSAATAIVQAMLAHGGDARFTAENGCPVLVYAADSCPAEVVEALVRGGANMTTPNRAGFDAMEMAISSGRTATVKALLALGYPAWNDRPALLEAAQGKPEIVALLKPPAAEPRPAAPRKKKT